MATPTKTPNKTTAKDSKTPAGGTAEGVKRTHTAEFDFSGIQVTDGAAPTRTGSRVAIPNPFLDHLRASATKPTDKGKGAWIGQGKTLTVTEAQAKAAVNLIRYAANRLNVGVTVAETPLPGGKVRIDFAAKSRKQKKAVAAAPTGNGS